MSHIGRPVVYRALEGHHTTTITGKAPHPEKPGEMVDVTVAGSVHHPEAKEFAGQVTRSHHDGSHDLIIFPPNRPPVHVDRAQEGEGWGSFTFVAGRPQKPTTKETGTA